LRSAYGTTTLSTTNGGSVTIAIVDAWGYPNAASDLATYRSKYGLPACGSGCFTKINQSGQQSGYPPSDPGWDQEQALDLDMVSAICPNCHILLVEANTNNDSDLAAAENTAAGWPGVHAISNSYGDAEYPGSTALEPSYNHPGIAITVSTGDSGFGAQFPAVSPHVTAVGGTSLTRASNSRGWSETAWSKAGSGCSSIYAQPSWQAAVSPLCGFRMEADTSAVADPNTGVAAYGPLGFFNLSGWLVVGGTSVGAPLTAGIYALNGGTVTYGSDPYSHTSSLNDVTSGSNGSCGGTYFCTAGPGYDGPTGLGTPKGDGAF
jgi:subtilase family serine protease